MNGQYVKLVEAVIRTKKGTEIKRYKNNVGKLVGPQLYVHKNYVSEVIPSDTLEKAKQILQQKLPQFGYNSIMFNSSNGEVRFDEAPDFDTAREPIVGNMVTIKTDGTVKTAKSNMIWHHKWLWVKDDYKGFNVDESKEWSQLWASKLEGIAKGNKEGFSQQLKAVGLE